MTTKDFKIQVFKHPQFGEIRVTGTSDEPLFCLVDICKVLEIKNASMAKRKLKGGGLKIIEVGSFVTNQYGDTAIEQKSFLTFISEQNLYRLIMRSTKPMAEPFQDWVCGEVLPSIRKHGGYILNHEGDTDEDIRRRAEEVLRATLEQKDSLIAQQEQLLHQQCVNIAEQKKLIQEQEAQLDGKCKVIAEQETEIDRLLPKALYSDNVLDSISCYTTTQIAKELGMTAQELNRQLCASHIQYYQSGQYMLYAEYAHMGLAKSRTHFELFIGRNCIRTRMYLVWTERGRRFIHDNVKIIKN